MDDTHIAAVEAAVGAARLTPADEPLVALVRCLARQVDGTGAEGPGTRLASTYLVALRTLMARCPPSIDGEGTTTLARLRAERQRPKPTMKRAVTRGGGDPGAEPEERGLA